MALSSEYSQPTHPFSHQIFTILTRGNISFKKTIKNFIHECIFQMFNRLLKKFSHQGRINILICPKNLFDPIVNSDIVLRANTPLVDFSPPTDKLVFYCQSCIQNGSVRCSLILQRGYPEYLKNSYSYYSGIKSLSALQPCPMLVKKGILDRKLQPFSRLCHHLYRK